MTKTAARFDTSSREVDLSHLLSAAFRPISLLAGLTAAGVLLVYLMGLSGILPALGWQLPVGAVLLGLLAWLHAPIATLARNGKGTRAFWLHAATMTAGGIALALLWDGVALVSVLMAWTAPLLLLPARLPRRRMIRPVVLSALATILILFLAARPLVARLPSNSTGSLAAVLLVASMLVLLLLQYSLTHVRRYHTLEGRLVGSLVPIIAVPILFTTAIAAYNAFSSGRQQFEDTLEAVTTLKSGQLEDLIQRVVADLGEIAEVPAGTPNVVIVLENPGANDEQSRVIASLAATQIRDFIPQHAGTDYEEILILDAHGTVVLSTYVLNQGASFADQGFFQQGITGPTARFTRYPGRQNSAGEYKLVSTIPLYGTAGGDVVGAVVGVVRPAEVLAVLQPTMGLENVSTYLVDSELNVVSTTPLPAGFAQAQVLRQTIQDHSGTGSSVYRNYAGTTVLGYYDWNPILQETVVAEVPQSAVAGRSLAAALASGMVGLLTLVIAGIAVLSTSRSISEPVTGLARAAENLATGQLTTRAVLQREDELGRLSVAFNSMADQLQGTISELERRVADRTRELEQQTARLRTAAEVARDASLAPTLEELLSRAASLLLDRFSADHVAIYLLDERHQYAVLQAAPSAIGERMLAENHRVLVGEKGAIGQAALTGDLQLVLQGHEGVLDAGDAYHPSTQSQLCLPLRTREGTIGLLDLQSDSAEAFTPADTAIMQLLADQLAAAIERSRLLLQSQERLGQLEHTYRRFTEQSWGAYSGANQRPVGYRYDNVRLDPVNRMPEEAQVALDSGRVYLPGDGAGEGSQMAYVPIRLRDQTLGVISAHFREGQPPARTLALLEQAADRLATALENVRLLEESLRRATKERLIGEMTAKISSSISVRNVLQTAVEVLGRAIPGSDVSIRFRSDTAMAGKDKPT
jgi:GAF domain-containing protein/HAMP domain-containing protein